MSSNYSEDKNIYSSSKRNRVNQSKRGRKIYKTSPKKKVINIFVIILSVIFAISGSVLVYANSMLSSTYDPLKENSIDMNLLQQNTESDISLQSPELTGNLIKDPLVLNVALFGSDIRPDSGGYGNSDTILLLSIDNRHQKLKLTSFMRDIWVRIPQVDYSGKLNAAYAAGGPKLSIETIERNFGVDIDRYAVVDFETFPQIIDTLGGVEITVTDEEAEYLNEHLNPGVPELDGAGTYVVNGDVALDHARNRHVGRYDFERTQRQRDVLMSIVNKFKSTKDITTIAKLMTQFLPSITTNITINEMTGLAQNSIKYMNYPMSQFRLPTDDNCRDEYDDTWGSILVIDDMDKAREDVARFIYEETADQIYGTPSTSDSTSSISGSSSNSR